MSDIPFPQVLRKQVEKKTLIDAMDTAMLIIDEICDEGYAFYYHFLKLNRLLDIANKNRTISAQRDVSAALLVLKVDNLDEFDFTILWEKKGNNFIFLMLYSFQNHSGD